MPDPTPKKALVAACGSGVLLFLSCADFDIWPLAWCGLVPILWAIDRAPCRRRAWLLGWTTGIVANVGGFYWIVGLLTRFAHLPTVVSLLGLFALAAYQGLVFLLFALAVYRIRVFSKHVLSGPLPMMLITPVVMVAFEALVPFMFPWYLAITQAWVTPIIQIADLTGPVGVTALLLVVNGAIYDVLTAKTKRQRVLYAGSAAGVLAICLGYGIVRMHQVDDQRAAAPSLQVGIVQGNIAFDDKGDRSKARQQLKELQQTSASLEARGAEFIMWPESSYPYAIDRSRTTLPEIRRPRTRDPNGAHSFGNPTFSVPLLFGAITREVSPTNPRLWDLKKYPFNSAVMLQNDRVVGRFDKIYLLAFGEYIPLVETFPQIRSVLPRAAGHFARGKEIVPFPLLHQGKTYRLGPMICYEDILPDFGRKLARHKPHLLVNITNDAWFGDTSEPWQHLALSVFRSVELRSDLVRAVNTGVSAFVDAAGRVTAKTYAIDPKLTPARVDSLLAQAALMEAGNTFYAQAGDIFAYLCIAILFGMWILWPRIRG